MTLKIIICWWRCDVQQPARAWRPGHSYRDKAAAIYPLLPEPQRPTPVRRLVVDTPSSVASTPQRDGRPSRRVVLPGVGAAAPFLLRTCLRSAVVMTASTMHSPPSLSTSSLLTLHGVLPTLSRIADCNLERSRIWRLCDQSISTALSHLHGQGGALHLLSSSRKAAQLS